MSSFCDKKNAIQTTGDNQVIRLQNCEIAISNALSSSSILFFAKAPHGLYSRFLTVFAVFSCEYFLAGANVAVFFVKGNTLAVILTRQVATWRLQKEKKIIVIIKYALPFRFLGYKLSLHGIVDGATKHESLMLFLAGRTQHLSDNNCNFKCPETSEKRIEFLAPFPINVQLRIRNLMFCRLIKHSGSTNFSAKFKDKLLTTILK